MSSFRKLVNGNCWPLFATSLCVSLCVHLISGQGIKDVFYKGSKPHDPFIENLQNSGTFECRSRGQLIRLNQRHFNDDYCDCEDDGKDEPGTSACSYILEPLGNYHCADDRYMMQEVHSSKVNDGICDCCDGSDEWLSSQSWKSTSCPQTCANIAFESKKTASNYLDFVRKGHERRQLDLHGPIQEAYKNIQLTIEKEKHEIGKLQALKKKVEVYKEHEERVEALRILELAKESPPNPVEGENKTESSTEFNIGEEMSISNDPNEDSTKFTQESHGEDYFKKSDSLPDLDRKETEKLDLDLDLAPITIPVEKSDGTKISLFDYIHEQEKITYIFSPAHEAQDEAEVKPQQIGSALQLNWRFTYLIILRTSGLLFSPIRALVEFVFFAPSMVLDLMVDSELVEDWNLTSLLLRHILKRFYTDTLEKELHIDSTETLYGVPEFFGTHRFGYTTIICTSLSDANSMLRQKCARSSDSEAAIKSPEAESLRQILSHIDQELDRHKKVYESHLNAFNQDFGPQREFSLLRNGCLKSHVGSYTYKFCAFQEVLQDQVNLGSFTNWDHSTDPEAQYTKMLFGGGAKCWNGPERSTVVELICGTTEEILSVDEPRTCEYRMVVSTHAACTDQILSKAQQEFDFWKEKI
uniref:Glucosidase 2 subunit beta n=1 Tax=Albugo laibachii Nc14 TaxID=890382 RepID=F0WTR8_9STRA|nr:glucosidase 2 subunit beta putative [Albugo laibachii Nc14]|eukprot:CCA24761.1 glucosidase 2 subunit beta putative [Albugo laibachii Nc14]